MTSNDAIEKGSVGVDSVVLLRVVQNGIGVGVVELRRPERRNAVDRRTAARLAELVRQVDADDSLHAG